MGGCSTLSWWRYDRHRVLATGRPLAAIQDWLVSSNGVARPGPHNDVVRGQSAKVDLAHYPAGVQDGWVETVLLGWQSPVDEATSACLVDLGYTGRQHPRDFLVDISEGATNVSRRAVILGMDRPFRLPFRRTKSLDARFVYGSVTDIRCYAANVDGPILQVRPLGTSEPQWPVSPSAYDHRLVVQYRPHTSDYEYEYHDQGRTAFTVVLAKIPGQRASDGMTVVGLKSARSGQWMAHSMGQGIIPVPMQREAHDLLFGNPVPTQDVAELQLSVDAGQARSQIVPVVNTESEAPVSLDKPTLAHVEGYRLVRSRQETARVALGLSLFDPSDPKDVSFDFADLAKTGIDGARAELEEATLAVVRYRKDVTTEGYDGSDLERMLQMVLEAERERNQ